MSKRYDEPVTVDVDAGMPSSFVRNGRAHQVIDVIGRWRIEGRWWEDGRDREYWRVEASAWGVRGGSSPRIAGAKRQTASEPPSHTAVWDLYHDRRTDRWFLERLWD